MSPCDELDIPPMLHRATMRLSRVRFTLRRMMVVVATAAVVFGLAVTVHRRKVRYERLAAYHLGQWRAWSAEAHEGIVCILRVEPPRSETEEVEWFTNAFGIQAGFALKRSIAHRHL